MELEGLEATVEQEAEEAVEPCTAEAVPMEIQGRQVKRERRVSRVWTAIVAQSSLTETPGGELLASTLERCSPPRILRFRT